MLLTTQNPKSERNSAKTQLTPSARTIRIKRQKNQTLPDSPKLLYLKQLHYSREVFFASRGIFKSKVMKLASGGGSLPRWAAFPPPRPQTLPSPRPSGRPGWKEPGCPRSQEEEPRAEPPAPPATPTKRSPPLSTEIPPAPPPRANREGHRTGERRTTARLQARARAAPSSLPTRCPAET